MSARCLKGPMSLAHRCCDDAARTPDKAPREQNTRGQGRTAWHRPGRCRSVMANGRQVQCGLKWLGCRQAGCLTTGAVPKPGGTRCDFEVRHPTAVFADARSNPCSSITFPRCGSVRSSQGKLVRPEASVTRSAAAPVPEKPCQFAMKFTTPHSPMASVACASMRRRPARLISESSVVRPSRLRTSSSVVRAEIIDWCCMVALSVLNVDLAGSVCRRPELVPRL